MSLSLVVRRIGGCSTSDRSITIQILCLSSLSTAVAIDVFGRPGAGQYFHGRINYFGIATGYQRCCDLDHWIRRRVRMAYWRQWRKSRTKVRNLIKLGVHVKAAVACGITSKGPWRNSKTPGIQQALSNDYLKAEGLVSDGSSLTIPGETPCVEPHAECCGGWGGLDTPGYPISFS